jgi:Sulfotransferase domain
VSATPLDVIIAGVNKAGTTSLFVSLSEHPQVAPSAVKETRYFTPARYGRPVEPRSVYDSYFAGTDTSAGGCRVRLEATPSYFYGGARLARLIDETLPDARIVLVLREPVSRTISFFQYQKTRLRIPEDLSIEEYLAHADTLEPSDFLDPTNERYFAVGGSRYADFLPAWLEQFGSDRLLVLSFEALTAEPARVLRETATWLGLDPNLLPAESLAAENKTTAFKSRRFQRLALTVNDRFERIFRRHPGIKRRMRALYFRFNGSAASGNRVSDAVRAELAERFSEPNERLAAQLRSAGLALPPWLSDSRSVRAP